jgi:DNA-binding transcriptional regulator YiaG
MPNIGSVLKDEITRLARRELKKEVGHVRKITATHRRDLAAIKRQLASAQKRIQLLERQASRTRAVPIAAESSEKPVRFVAKGLVSLRKRLGLSAAGLAKLIDVSEQSVYNWEAKKTVPRRQQVEAIAGLRGLGKREAHARLEKLGK